MLTFRSCIFSLTTQKASLNIFNVTRSRGRFGPRKKIPKEALNGDKEKGCQEEEKKITRSGAKSPRIIKGK
jgi:hypothetical protein